MKFSAIDNCNYNYINASNDESNYLSAALNLSEITRFFKKTPAKKLQRRASRWASAVNGQGVY